MGALELKIFLEQDTSQRRESERERARERARGREGGREGGRGKASEGKKEEPVNKTETGITAGALDTGGVFGMDGWTQKRIGRDWLKGENRALTRLRPPKKTFAKTAI